MMNEFNGRASARIDAEPRVVFDLLTDPGRLTEWNAAIEAVVDAPDILTEGAEWTVAMHPPKVPRWQSVSRALEVDREHLRFTHETRNGDGNPSWVDWSWTVSPAGTGAEVVVTWTCHLETFDRRYLAGPIRKRQLAREVPASLAALAGALELRPTA